jgi:tRNA threonylcarbamoyladenosine biosynthesis protein TsaB
MPGLHALSSTGPVLILDASASLVQVGLVGPGSSRWETSSEEAGVAVFAGVEKLGVNFDALAALVFCEGPGSILGIRTTAAALRAWQVLRPKPIYAYSSLALLSAARGDPSVTYIADARRESWHLLNPAGTLQRVATADLPAKGIFATPDSFRHWSALPPGTQTVPYHLDSLWASAAQADLLHAVTEPDAFLHEEPSYVTWQPAIHQAPRFT